MFHENDVIDGQQKIKRTDSLRTTQNAQNRELTYSGLCHARNKYFDMNCNSLHFEKGNERIPCGVLAMFLISRYPESGIYCT